MTGRPLALRLYLLASSVAAPVARPILARRRARGKEDGARLAERLGRPGLPRPAARVIWLHGASVGEAMSMLPLIDALRAVDRAAEVLVTTGTVTSARRIAPLLPGHARHQFVPVDTGPAVRRFLDHWRPDLAIWVESELWPRLIEETARRAVPMALVNARLSEASARSWGWAQSMAHRLLSRFQLVLTQDEETLHRLRSFGVAARFGGNLKALVPAPEAAPAALAEARALAGDRPVWLAASTHQGEDGWIAQAHAIVRRSYPDALLILAPRHAERGDALAAEMRAAGFATAQRAAGEAPGPGTAVWLADTMGEMGLWYRLAEVTFVGGSLVERGGHTPFEPAHFQTAILHGPHVDNFAPAYAAFGAAGGAEAVLSGERLGALVARLIGDPRERADRAAAAQAAHAGLRPDVAAMAHALLALLPAPAGPGGP